MFEICSETFSADIIDMGLPRFLWIPNGAADHVRDWIFPQRC